MTYFKIFWSDLQYPKNKSEKPLSWKSSIFSISSGMWSSHFRAEQKILCRVISHLASSVAWQFIDEKFQDNLILFPQRFYVSGSNASLLAPAGHLTDHNTLQHHKFFALIAYHFTLCFLPNEESAVVCKEQNSPKHATFLHGHDQFSSSALLIKTATLPTLFFTMRCQILS